MDSAVTQYLSQVSELGYRPTNSGSKLTTFIGSDRDWKDRNNSVSSVNSRTSERLLAVEFQLHSNKQGTLDKQKIKNIGNYVDNDENRQIVSDNEEEIQVVKTIIIEEFESDEKTPSVDNPVYLNLIDCSAEQDHFYENGEIEFSEEPIYENLEASFEAECSKEPLYDTVPRRPLVSPKPEKPVKTAIRKECLSIADENVTNPTHEGSRNSLSTESLSDSLSQDSNHSLKRRENKLLETHEQNLILDGSETSDLGSSGSEDVASFEEWPCVPSLVKSNSGISNSKPCNLTNQSNPELALQKLEDEVLAELEWEKQLNNQIKTVNDSQFIENVCGASSVEAFNSSIVEVCRSKDEIAEAKIIDDDTGGSSDDIYSIPAIRHSVIIELKDSATKPENKKNKILSRSGSLNAAKKYIDDKVNSVGSKTLSKQNRRMSETGLGINVNIKCNPVNGTEFEDSTKQVIKISSSNFNSSKKVNNKAKASSSGKKTKGKSGKMVEPIAAPPSGFLSTDGSDGVFSASCVALTSAPNSLTNACSSEMCTEINTNRTIISESPSKKKVPFWYEEPDDINEMGSFDQNSKKKNIGYAIMESYEKELSKKKKRMNLPEVSMVDFGGSANDLEIDRKNVIKQMIVKTKKKDSWLHGVSATDLDASFNTRTKVSTVKRSNSMSAASPKATKNNSNVRPVSSILKKSENSAHILMNMKKSVPEPHVSDDDSEDFVFPSFMHNESNEADKPQPKNPQNYYIAPPKPDPLPDFSSIDLTIEKLGLNKQSPTSPPYAINKHLTSITPFKSSNQNKHCQIKASIHSKTKVPLSTAGVAGNDNDKYEYEETNQINSLQTALYKAKAKLDEKKIGKQNYILDNISPPNTDNEAPSTAVPTQGEVTTSDKPTALGYGTVQENSLPRLTKENVDRVSQAATLRGEF